MSDESKMDTPETRIARAIEIDRALPPNWKTEADMGAPWNIVAADGTDICLVPQQDSPTKGPDLKRAGITTLLVEMRNTYGAIAADAKRAIRYERNLCSIAKVLTDAGVPLTVETADGPTIDRIHERVVHLVADAKRTLKKLQESEANRIGTVKGMLIERNEAQRIADEAREDLSEVKDQLAAARKKNAELNRRAQANESSWMAARKECNQAEADAKREREEVEGPLRTIVLEHYGADSPMRTLTTANMVKHLVAVAGQYRQSEELSRSAKKERDRAIERAEKAEQERGRLAAEVEALKVERTQVLRAQQIGLQDKARQMALPPESLAVLLGIDGKEAWDVGCPRLAFRSYMITIGAYATYVERGGTPIEADLEQPLPAAPTEG